MARGTLPVITPHPKGTIRTLQRTMAKTSLARHRPQLLRQIRYRGILRPRKGPFELCTLCKKLYEALRGLIVLRHRTVIACREWWLIKNHMFEIQLFFGLFDSIVVITVPEETCSCILGPDSGQVLVPEY